MSFVVKAGRLVAHLVVVVVTGGLVVLIIVLVVVHRVRVLGLHVIPVDVLAACATTTLDDVLLRDGLEIVVIVVIVI